MASTIRAACALTLRSSRAKRSHPRGGDLPRAGFYPMLARQGGKPMPQARQTSAAIQPHGWLIACDARASRILAHSDNLAALLPDWSGPFIGARLGDALGSETAHGLRNALARFNGAPARPALLPGLRLAGLDRAFDLTVSRSGDAAIVEIEPAPLRSENGYDRIGALIDRIAAGQEIEKLCAAATRLLSSVLQYDRVALFRFSEGGQFRLLAQQKAHDLVVADSPGAATREFLASGRLRMIADAGAAPEPICAAQGAAPLDLSDSFLRAAAADERALLQDAGFSAVLALPLLIEGEAWGLILCQHRAPRAPGMELRATADLFRDLLALRLETLLLRQGLREAAAD
jgi:light-regulated signal transduction histidine kinase (bacteriophytochrome)